MASPRLLCTVALLEIAWILMQERWQNSVAYQVFGNGVGEASPQPLAISLRILGPMRGVSALLDGGPPSHTGEESGLGEIFVSQVKLHLGAKRLGMRLVSHIKVRYETENALLLFNFELLGSNLLRRIIYRDRALHSQNAKFDLGKSLVLPGFDCNGRTPVCKSFSGDGDLIGDSGRGLVECKASVVFCDSRETVASRPLKEYCGTGNRIVARIDHSTEDPSCSCIWRFSRLGGHGYCNDHSA